MAPGRFEAMLKAIIGFELRIECAARHPQARPDTSSTRRADRRGRRAGAVQPRHGGADAPERRRSMTPPDDNALWRNRFILMNLIRIAATVGVLLAILLWQSDIFVRGGTILGFPLAPPSASSSASSGPNMRRTNGGRRRSREALLREPRRVGEGRRILLDGRPVKTPARRRPRRCPRDALADAVADEWNAQGERDRPARHAAHRPRQCRDRPGRARSRRLRARPRRLWRSDLLCYRAEGPAPLVAAAGRKLGPAARLGAAALRRRCSSSRRQSSTSPSRRRRSRGWRGGRRARSVPRSPACRRW